jgi:hypothetical protein
MARARDGRRRRWPWVLLGFAVLLLVIIGLGMLARPLADVKPEADTARDELAAAEDSLRAEDLDAANAHIAVARAHVDEASSRINGFGADVWRWVPVAGGAVKDARHLVGALDHATSIAEIGAGLYPDVMQSDTLVQNATVDLDQLDRILEGVNDAGVHLKAASDDLDAVKGNTPIVGDSVLAARDSARGRVDPLLTTYDDMAPVLDALPDVLGGAGKRTYLVAMMNPAEMRYSGGATLTMATLELEDGQATFGDPVTNEDVVQNGDLIKWPKVKGNPFHTPGRTRLTNATFSPNWSQSGEELLRAWEAVYGQKCDGVIAIDLQGLARMMALTGPVQVPGVGELNSGNLVQVLAGSYDTYDMPDERQAINAAVVPAFREKLLQGGQLAQKFQLLADAATGRHFAMYFRDSRLQQAFVDRHLSGDLSDTPNDYLGVFTQNLNESKADYWQHRTVASDVKLAADGSADVTLTVTVQNPSPPYVHGEPGVAPDPHFGYYTRWAGNSVAVFLPRDAQVIGQATIRGLPFKPVVRSVSDRPYFYRKVTLEPAGQAVLVVKYHVPAAAKVGADGTLSYRLDIDPQSLVAPEAVSVTLHIPQGYAAELPPGWTATGGRSMKFDSAGLDDSPRFTIELTKS